MSRTIIFAIALSLVLVSGSIFSAQADCCFNLCGWHFPSCGCSSAPRDRDIDSQTGYPRHYLSGFPTDYYNNRVPFDSADGLY